jgi:hypothetical protein
MKDQGLEKWSLEEETTVKREGTKPVKTKATKKTNIITA